MDVLGIFNKAYDLIVLHPHTKLENNIPPWNINQGKKRINIHYKGENEQHYYATLYSQQEIAQLKTIDNTIPYCVIPFTTEIDMDVYLKKKAYFLIIMDDQGIVLQKTKV